MSSRPAAAIHGPAAIVIAVWALCTALWLTPGITRPDGAGYYAYLPSTYFDHDLLFFDEWAKVGLIRGGEILFKDVTPTGHLSNHWTAGASLAWYPAFVAADAAARVRGERRDGFSPPYVAAVAFTSALAGLFVLLAGYAVAARLVASRPVAAAAAIAIWLGSPLAFYSLRHATMAHAISAAACAAVVLLSLRLRDRITSIDVFATGMAIGFACAVRPQNVTIALVPLVLAPASIRRAHLLFGGALLAALPQLIVSQTLWSAPLAFVNIGGRAHPWQMFHTFRPLETMFSWYHGLATWTPLLLLALLGLGLLWRRDRRLALAGLLTFATQWLLLSVLERWFWGGASFGQRRFDSCLLFFILGIATLLDRLPRWLGALLTIATAGWTLLLLIAVPRLNLNAYQPLPELLDAIALGLRDPQWHTILGYTPPGMHTGVLAAILTTLATIGLLFLLLRRHPTLAAAIYLIAISAFYAWCGLHPHYDPFSRAVLATPQPSGSALDTRRLLLYEADYMERTGQPAKAAAARQEAAALTTGTH